MKKYTAIVMSLIMMLTATGCSAGAKGASAAGNPLASDKIKVVTTIFPEYDWAKQVVGDDSENVDLTLLLDNGTDLHSYQPTTEDMLKISEADLFIYVGGESDTWVDDALKNATNKDMKVINLMETLGDDIKEEEVVEGMEAEEEEEEEGEGHDEVEYDEHVWLSLENAETIVNEIAKNLAEVDKENAEKYENNAETYNEKLDTLAEEYKSAAQASKIKTVLFGDRFPFRYLTDELGLKYYAAFVGCSAETEASFETITFLANKVDELSLPVVLTIENSDQKIAKTIVENTKGKNQKILTLDSMQSVKRADIDEGKTYLSIMESNLEVLEAALGN
ncbi:MAG: metal ABC transporter substrate-binding protein [Lachnospiraceae bacterium]|nr:metal ABC transporter substrate-binding protein [Lachnospiraceae bacterium]